MVDGGEGTGMRVAGPHVDDHEIVFPVPDPDHRLVGVQPDAHHYVAWRDRFDPNLAELLTEGWGHA